MKHDDPWEDVRTKISEEAEALFNKQAASIMTGNIEKNGNQSVRLEDLFECKKRLDRFDKVYMIECHYLPDDCYGVMYVRPEDMPNRRSKDEGQGSTTK